MSSASKLIMSATLPSPVCYNLNDFPPTWLWVVLLRKSKEDCRAGGGWEWGADWPISLLTVKSRINECSVLGLSTPPQAGGTWHGCKTIALVSETGGVCLHNTIYFCVSRHKTYPMLDFVSVIYLKSGDTSGNSSEKARCYTNFYFCCSQDY